MRIINRILYLLINIYWAFSVIITIPYAFDVSLSITHLINTFSAFLIIVFQVYAGIHLMKNKLTLPIIATIFFLLNFDFGGVLFATSTAFNVLFTIGLDYINIIAGINEPAVLLNFSFTEFQFDSIELNLVTMIQLFFLYSEFQSLNAKEC